MDRITIFKQVVNHAVKAKFIPENNIIAIYVNRDGLIFDINSDGTSANLYAVISNSKKKIASWSEQPLVAYCGGINFGNISIEMSHMRNKLPTLIFITELIYYARFYKAFVVTTNNSTQEPWCSYIRRLLSKSSTVITEQHIVNSNTGNDIVFTTFNSYSLSITMKHRRFEKSDVIAELIDDYLNSFMPVPKEEPKPVIPDASNSTNNTGTAKSNKAAPVRAPQVRKKYRSQWTSQLLNN